MRNIFVLFIITSLVFLSQKNLFIKSNSSYTESAFSGHQHKHSVVETMKMVFLGIVEHNHEHEHSEDFPSSSSQSHDSKEHSHAEGGHVKVELISPKSTVYIQVNKKVTYVPNYLLIPYFEYNSEIFKPPILS